MGRVSFTVDVLVARFITIVIALPILGESEGSAYGSSINFSHANIPASHLSPSLGLTTA